MKIAAISDIHGNLAALDAVFSDIRIRAVDEIVNLGDICSGGLLPSETADRLIPLEIPDDSWKSRAPDIDRSCRADGIVRSLRR